MDLTLTTRAIGDRTVLDVAGEVDVYSAPTLRDRIAELLEASPAALLVNLCEVTFLDSTGIGILVASLNRAVQLGGSLSLVCDHERILKLFRITGLDAVFTIQPTVEDAISS